MSDEEVIRRRLLIDGDGTGDDRRLNNFIKGLIKWTNTSQLSANDNEAVYDRLLAQLSQCEHAAKKSQILMNTNNQQYDSYKDMEVQLGDKIQKVKMVIEEKKVSLEEAKVWKENRMQYDLLAQSVKQQPARNETHKRLSALKNELDELTEEKNKLEGVMEARRKQFYVLSSSANQIKLLLDKKRCEETINTSLDDITNSPGPEPMSE